MNATLTESMFDTRHVLGEGPFWPADESGLFWVDIKRGEVWHALPGQQPHCIFSMPEPISSAILASDGQILLTGKHSIYVLNQQNQEVSELVRLPGEPEGNRCNDARTDPWGNLWIGTMDDAGQSPSGSLWRLSREGELEKIIEGVIISNTLVWDMSRDRFYFGDSGRGAIHVFDARIDSPVLKNQRVFLENGAAPGVPDGSALDDEGGLWNARWDGSCLVRVSPEGAIVEQIKLPVRRPTSCAFGVGNELFVTTALPGNDETSGPFDGAILRMTTSLGGAAGCEYAGPVSAAHVRIGNLKPKMTWLV